MAFNVDFSDIRIVRIHKEQFDAIDKKAVAILLECKEDGQVIAFNRVDKKTNKDE